jgi:hypothetical protein
VIEVTKALPHRLLRFNDLKVGQRVKVRSMTDKDGEFVALTIHRDISKKARADKAVIESFIQSIDHQRKTLHLLNREVALPDGIVMKDSQRNFIGWEALKVGDWVKLQGKYSARKGFVPEKIKVKASRGFDVGKLQGKIDKIDQEKKTLDLAGCTLRIRKFSFSRKILSRKTPPYSYREFCKRLLSMNDVKVCNYAEFDYYNSEKYPFDIRKENLAGKKTILLRHDIDYDPFIALRMAEIEADLGIRSSYYMLTTDSDSAIHYYNNEFPRMVKALQEMQALGHEIGLHYDFFGDYFSNGLDPKENVEQILKKLRDHGLRIQGCAAHGSMRMRKFVANAGMEVHPRPREYVNYLIWEEVRPQKTTLKLEGKELRIPYLRLSDYGLRYEAYFVRRDGDVSDTGGNFWWLDDLFETIESKMDSGQILTILAHPIRWKRALE